MGLSSCKPILKCDCYVKNEDELVNMPNEVNQEKQNKNIPIEQTNNKKKKHSTDLTDNPYLDRINLSPIKEINKENGYYDDVGKDDNVFNSINIKKELNNQFKSNKIQFSNYNESENNENKETSNKFQNDSIELYDNKSNINNNNNNGNYNENNDDYFFENYNKNLINNDIVYKFSWKNIDVLSIIPESKLQSNDMNIIVNYGYLNKFLLTTTSNVEKYCLLSKSYFCLYKSKETVLRKQKPFLMMSLKDIEKCDIVYMDFLNKKNLEDFYFFYILKKNLKFQIPQINNIVFNEEISEEYDMKNNSEVYNLLCLKKNILEQIFSRNDLIILYTENEDECIKWVCLINYFINYYKQKI